MLAEVTNGTTEVSYTYGDDLVSQTRAGTPSYYLYDGHGSTRALADASGSLTDSYDYDAFGLLLNSSGDTENAYRYTGEQLDSSLDQYYLRARYYDQGVGRFTQQDTWMGKSQDPITLNKYLYANADPVTNTDPTGFFSLSSLSVGMNGAVQLGSRAVGSSALRFAVRKAVRGAIQHVRSTGKLAIKTARQCLRKEDKCKLGIPMLVVGADNGAVAQHILDSQTGGGSNVIGGTLTLNYKASARFASPSQRNWYRNRPECSRASRNRWANIYGSNHRLLDCDEYPMFSTYQGGSVSPFVSLRPVPRSQNRSVGALSQWLYRSFKFENRKAFLVIASPSIPVSAWIPER